MEALTQSDCDSMLEMVQLLCSNDRFADVMKGVIKGLEKSEEFVPKTITDRFMSCLLYFEKNLSLFNVITDNHYQTHLPIINFITDKAFQAITHNVDNDDEFQKICKIHKDPKFEMLCKECKIDNKQMNIMKIILLNLTLKLDDLDSGQEIELCHLWR